MKFEKEVDQVWLNAVDMLVDNPVVRQEDDARPRGGTVMAVVEVDRGALDNMSFK